MLDYSSNNKRIAKNTLLLYARMLYSLFISLFTSRVILTALGFEDYGLYNVVGSVVSMFVFLRTAMGNSVNRYMTFSIGEGDMKKLKKVFSLSMLIHIGLALLIILLCETIGSWFLNTYMKIPVGREVAANWVFQFSIFSCALAVICVPYDALIIAHEKMGIFAIIQVFNSTLNLIIVFAVKYYSNDRLVFYGFLLMMVQILNRIIYGIYCGRHFPETKLKWVNEKSLFKEMINFAGWSLIGNLAWVGYTQGLNLLLNVFFGPIVNAARGIAYQIQGAIKGFVTNFQMAVSPQITKSYANGDFLRMHTLIYSSSKFSFFLLLCLIMPIAIESQQILHIWLGNVPNYTVPFTKLTLATMLVDTLSNPIGVANNATGKIRIFQIVEGGTLLMVVPVSYLAIKMGGCPTSVFVVQFVILWFVQFLRLFLVCHKIKMSIKDYCRKVLFRIFLVTILSLVLPLTMYYLLNNTIWNCFIIIVLSILSVLFFSYLLGLDMAERNIIKQKFKFIIKKVQTGSSKKCVDRIK